MTNGSPESFFAAFDLEDDNRNSPNSPNNTSFFEKWIKMLSELTRCWHSYSYRMPSMTMAIKDDGFCLSLGMNVQFKIGNFTLCGHINNISSSCSVSENGAFTNQTVIGITRVCMVRADGNLSFLPMDAIGRLFTDIQPLDIGLARTFDDLARSQQESLNFAKDIFGL